MDDQILKPEDYKHLQPIGVPPDKDSELFCAYKGAEFDETWHLKCAEEARLKKIEISAQLKERLP